MDNDKELFHSQIVDFNKFVRTILNSICNIILKYK